MVHGAALAESCVLEIIDGSQPSSMKVILSHSDTLYRDHSHHEVLSPCFRCLPTASFPFITPHFQALKVQLAARNTGLSLQPSPISSSFIDNT
jgi:hypothetical protein